MRRVFPGTNRWIGAASAEQEAQPRGRPGEYGRRRGPPRPRNSRAPSRPGPPVAAPLRMGRRFSSPNPLSGETPAAPTPGTARLVCDPGAVTGAGRLGDNVPLPPLWLLLFWQVRPPSPPGGGSPEAQEGNLPRGCGSTRPAKVKEGLGGKTRIPRKSTGRGVGDKKRITAPTSQKIPQENPRVAPGSRDPLPRAGALLTC